VPVQPSERAGRNGLVRHLPDCANEAAQAPTLPAKNGRVIEGSVSTLERNRQRRAVRANGFESRGMGGARAHHHPSMVQSISQIVTAVTG
jgi:hypothetical protein